MNLSGNTGSSYDTIMGQVMDAQDHPANNIPDVTPQNENNPMNPANEFGQSPMKEFSSFGKPKSGKKK